MYQWTHWIVVSAYLESKFKLAIDIGAHVGAITRYMLPNFETVVAIEPNPLVRPFIRKNCSGTDHLDRLKVVPYMVGKGKGERGKLVLARKENTGSGAVIPDPEGQEIVSLDTIAKDFSDVDLIKIDTQEDASDILEGGWNTITTHLPVMWIEGPPGCPAEATVRKMGASIGARLGNNFFAGFNSKCRKGRFVSYPD